MKESQIRKKALETLEKNHWHCWWPKKVRYQETDVFGIYDILALKGNVVRWIQITTASNISARRKKIEGFLKSVKSSLPSEVWGWDKKRKDFKIINIL